MCLRLYGSFVVLVDWNFGNLGVWECTGMSNFGKSSFSDLERVFSLLEEEMYLWKQKPAHGGLGILTQVTCFLVPVRLFLGSLYLLNLQICRHILCLLFRSIMGKRMAFGDFQTWLWHLMWCWTSFIFLTYKLNSNRAIWTSVRYCVCLAQCPVGKESSTVWGINKQILLPSWAV